MITKVQVSQKTDVGVKLICAGPGLVAVHYIYDENPNRASIKIMWRNRFRVILAIV